MHWNFTVQTTVSLLAPAQMILILHLTILHTDRWEHSEISKAVSELQLSHARQTMPTLMPSFITFICSILPAFKKVAAFTILWMSENIQEQEIKLTSKKGTTAITKLIMTLQPSREMRNSYYLLSRNCTRYSVCFKHTILIWFCTHYKSKPNERPLCGSVFKCNKLVDLPKKC